MSVNRGFPEKLVVLRTGGLGDFVLTVPLLVTLAEAGCQVTVATRRSYFDILGGSIKNLTFMDADYLLVSSHSHALRQSIEGATVLSFWKDRDGSLEARFQALGAQKVVELESRPSDPPHIVNRILQTIGIQWEEKIYKRSWLGPERLQGDCLWVHPGSGSPTKNLPIAWFVQRIRRWLAEEGGERVLVSFGEADHAVEESFRLIGGDMPLQFIHPQSFVQLRQELVTKAALFVGNDTGPTHVEHGPASNRIAGRLERRVTRSQPDAVVIRYESGRSRPCPGLADPRIRPVLPGLPLDETGNGFGGRPLP